MWSAVSRGRFFACRRFDSMTSDLLVRGTHLWSGKTVLQRADLLVRRGRVAAIGADLPTAPDVQAIDAPGCLAVPGLVDGHAHLDKTLWGTPWHPHQAR